MFQGTSTAPGGLSKVTTGAPDTLNPEVLPEAES